MAIPRWAGAVNGGFKGGAMSVAAYLAFTQLFDKNLEPPVVGMIKCGAAAAWTQPSVPLQQISNAFMAVGRATSVAVTPMSSTKTA